MSSCCNVKYLLPFLLLFPVFSAACVALVPRHNTFTIRVLSLASSLIVFIASLTALVAFDNKCSHFQFVTKVDWVYGSNVSLYLGIDGISLFFILLTTFLVPLCFLSGWKSVTKYVKEYCISFLLLETCVLGVFCTLDLLVFYFFFEALLLPIFALIGVFGSRSRKIKAAYQFFLYTLLGSLLMLFALLVLYFQAGTSDYQVLLSLEVSHHKQLLLWLALFIAFAVKVPVIPLHIWLPEAHVEAPTSGSVILAGVLLKLGAYGFLRFSIALLPFASEYFGPFVFVLCAVNIVYASLTALRMVDLKKMIAYSSIAHIGFVIIGLFSLNVQGIEGALLLILSHGIVASGLFLCVGVLYDRTHTRLIHYYGGLVQTIPLFSLFFLVLIIGNISVPGTSSFVGESIVLFGMLQTNTPIAAVSAGSMVLGTAYSLWLYNRVSLGSVKSRYTPFFSDLSRRECSILFPILFLTLFMGLCPGLFLEPMHLSVAKALRGGI